MASPRATKTSAYAKDQGIPRVKRFWRLYKNRRKAGHRFFTYPALVHLYFISYNGLAGSALYDPGFLDQYQKLYSCREKKPD